MVKCQNCQTVIQCDNCDIALVYHKSDNALHCHTCGALKPFPAVCPKCQSNSFMNIGYGTQKLVEELARLFPGANILRMDRDTTGNKAAAEKILETFRQRKGDILVGTQMIAKGLDFPEVSLVGILNSDALLSRLDFKAQETTFALLMQAAGRAGRQIKDSTVIIQTFQPKHYVLRLVKEHNYVGFFNQEMQYRKLTGYPPYQYLVLLTLPGQDIEKMLAVMSDLKNDLIEAEITVLGPSELLRKNNQRFLRLTLKGKDLAYLQKSLKEILPKYQQHPIVVDVNPGHTEL